MTEGAPERAEAAASYGATGQTVELAFDLVFVFMITQLARTLVEGDGWVNAGLTVLIVVLLWWTFGSYVALDSAAKTRAGRVVLGLGMVASFVIALAIPYAFGSDRLIFAVGYAVIVALHTALYLIGSGDVSWARVRQVSIVNAPAPVLVLAGGIVGGPGQIVLWVLAALCELALPRLAEERTWGRHDQLPALAHDPARFVQRHGVLLIVVLAQALLTLGVTVGTAWRALTPGQMAASFVGLALGATLFIAYFGERDDARAYAALAAAGPRRRHTLAALGFGYAFAVMLIGVDLAVAGIHQVMKDGEAPIGQAFGGYLAGGVAAYWIGLGLFRLSFGLSLAWLRIVCGLLLGATALLGLVSGLAQLAALLVGSLVIIVIEVAVKRRDPHPDPARAPDLPAGGG